MERLFPKELLSRREIDANGCWNYTGSHDAEGYGFYRGKRVHVISAELCLHYQRESKLSVCHSCDNPPCCNPAHLWVRTQAQNIRDAASKGRLWRSTCKAGHPLEGDNLVIFSTGRRNCRICRNAGKKKYKSQPRVKARAAAWMKEKREKQGVITI